MIEELKLRDAAYHAWIDADKAWSLELQRAYGNQAGDKRYTADGVATPTLRRLYAAMHTAGEEYRAAQSNYIDAKRELQNVD